MCTHESPAPRSSYALYLGEMIKNDATAEKVVARGKKSSGTQATLLDTQVFRVKVCYGLNVYFFSGTPSTDVLDDNSIIMPNLVQLSKLSTL